MIHPPIRNKNNSIHIIVIIVIKVIIISVAYSQVSKSQLISKYRYEALYGKWYVENYYLLTVGNTNLNHTEKKELENEIKKCKKSNFIIDSVRIENCSNECGFLNCFLPFDNVKFADISIVKEETYEMKKYPGNEIEFGVVGKTFIKLMDKNFNADKITIIETSCKSVTDDYVIIFILSDKKIALYTGEDLIVLVKKFIKT